MADTINSEQRSKNMAAIRSKNTRPEIYLRKLLFAKGFRYRIAEKSITGHPDIFLRKYNTAVFVHGCFWHRHQNCKYAYTPKTRAEFWQKKFNSNIQRDRAVEETLHNKKIRCIVIWECTIRKMMKSSDMENQIITQCIEFIYSQNIRLEL